MSSVLTPANPGTATPRAAATAATTPTKGTRYPLDSIRALAAICVIVFHAYQNNRVSGQYAWTGLPHALMMSSDLAVDLFFVISGFLLWTPVSRALLAGRPQRAGGQLLARRSVRLLPLYVTVLLIAWTAANPSLPGHWQDLLAHLTMTHVYSDQYIFWTIGPAWTLAIEFHAFVLVALLLAPISAMTPRLRTSRARVVLAVGVPSVLGAIGLAYLSAHIILLDTPDDAWAVWFGPLAKIHLFAVGMIMAVVSAAGVRIGRGARWAVGLSALGALAAGVTIRASLHSTASEWLHVLFALVAAGMLATIVLTRDAQPRWLAWGPMVWIGTVSYSLYLVHEQVLHALRASGLLPPVGTPLGIAVTAVATVALALAVARAAYMLIERPLMQAYDGTRRVPDRYAEVGSESG